MSRRTFFEIAEPLLGLIALGAFLAVLLLAGCDMPDSRAEAPASSTVQGPTLAASAQRVADALSASAMGAGS